MDYFIYTLSDPISMEIKYIGKTKNLKDRLQRHMSPCNLKQTWQSKTKWLKYLKNNNLKPIMEQLDIGDENNINELEIYWISQFKSWGFNLKNETIGGQNPTPKGTKLKERHINNLKNSTKNKKSVVQYTINNVFIAEYNSISEATRLTKLCHISMCCYGKRKSCGNFYFRFKDNYFPYMDKIDYWTGAHHNIESIKKIKMHHPLRKTICQYRIDTNELINEYDSSYDASNITNLSRNHICKCCRGIKSYNSVGGYYFRFKDNYFPFVKQYASIGKLRKKYKIDII